MHLDAINIRDPFVLPQPSTGWYYLYGTAGATCWQGRPAGFDTWRSRDLSDWEGPLSAFRPPDGFWATHQFWAPEVHLWQDRYYLFATFKADGVCRGTQIFVADDAAGPFVPLCEGPVTPHDWECLDGTLHVDADGSPWIVFCHEWLQVGDGTVCAIPLDADLRLPIGPPVVLFRASDAPWTKEIAAHGTSGRVTDGPFMLHLPTGRLAMLWSSVGVEGYAMGLALSDGDTQGPWRQQAAPIFGHDGGHGMLFQTFAGDLRLALHTPNQTPLERPIFLPTTLTDKGVQIVTP